MLASLAVGIALVGAGAGVRGIALLGRGLAYADDDRSSLDVIRGIRGVVIAVAAAALAGGMLFEQRWLLVFGTVFLLEELYETGVIILVLRADRATAGPRRSRRERRTPRATACSSGGEAAG
jgi:hypothetical protein